MRSYVYTFMAGWVARGAVEALTNQQALAGLVTLLLACFIAWRAYINAQRMLLKLPF